MSVRSPPSSAPPNACRCPMSSSAPRSTGCARAPRRGSPRQRGKRCLVCRRDGGARHRRIHRRGQRPALRGAGGVLRPRAGPEPQIFLLLLQGAASTLQEAEEEALRQTVEHADLADGQSILELGCGWGSLSLWMARQFPHAQVTAVSNSNSQREYIEAKPQARPDQPARRHCRHERVRAERSSTASSPSRCSST